MDNQVSGAEAMCEVSYIITLGTCWVNLGPRFEFGQLNLAEYITMII